MATGVETLERVFHGWPGIAGLLGTVDHKRIGRRYLITTAAFFLIGGVEALIIRAQLAVPDNDLVSAQRYNELFTMHGTTMIFLFATPVVAGLGNYLVPLMIGARDMAYPRLNAFSYWIYLFAGALMYSSFFAGSPPDGGWFAYPPLTGDRFSPSLGLDFWTIGIAFLGISTTAGGINFAVTIFKLRAPGMAVHRMPLFVWSILVTSFIMMFALTPLTLATVMLQMDRALGTAFFVPEAGGSPLLYQHLFWIFGHPEVYLVFIPATGVVSSVIATFTRRPIVGYPYIVTSMVAIGFISFGVWVHHMFATGIPDLTNSYFAAASMIISIPSGVQMFAWIATMWRAPIAWTVPMLFATGFLVNFLLGGVTGVMVATVPFDLQVHDSYFVVAHFHYVLIGGVVFPTFAALAYWLPKITGRMLPRRAGVLSFWLLFAGFNVAFFPQHLLGLWGMPRRVYTYPAGLGWDALNMVSTVGAFTFGLGTLVFVWAVISSLRSGSPAGPNPWKASTLEWAIDSPPPHHNFARVPLVRSREPLWDQPDLSEAGGEESELEGPGRLALTTVDFDARPEEVVEFPEDSYAPVVTALGLAVACGGVLARESFGIGLGLLIFAGAVLRWTWPWRSEP